MAAPGAPSQLPLSTPGAPSGSSPNRHATALLVNTLTLPGYVSPNYSTTAALALPGKPSLLTAFVLCVWAVYQRQRTPGSKSYAIMSVHHEASVTEDGGSDEGITWWSRACNADREAVILIDSADAELLLQDAEHYRRPPKPRAPPPPVLLHWDGH